MFLANLRKCICLTNQTDILTFLQFDVIFSGVIVEANKFSRFHATSHVDTRRYSRPPNDFVFAAVNMIANAALYWRHSNVVLLLFSWWWRQPHFLFTAASQPWSAQHLFLRKKVLATHNFASIIAHVAVSVHRSVILNQRQAFWWISDSLKVFYWWFERWVLGWVRRWSARQRCWDLQKLGRLRCLRNLARSLDITAILFYESIAKADAIFLCQQSFQSRASCSSIFWSYTKHTRWCRRGQIMFVVSSPAAGYNLKRIQYAFSHRTNLCSKSGSGL